MNRAELIDHVLYLDELARVVKEQSAAARAILEDQARAEYAQGIKPSWTTKTAVVPMSVSTPKFVVTNRPEFTKWVAERHPENIETLTQVRPAFETAVVARLVKLGEEDPVSDDGELIPGLTFVPGGEPGGISVRPNAGAKKAMNELARATLAQLLPNTSQNGESE